MGFGRGVSLQLGAHDTIGFTFCYHAPDNTETYTDTITLTYNDASGSRQNTRIVAAAATDTTPPDGALELLAARISLTSWMKATIPVRQ